MTPPNPPPPVTNPARLPGAFLFFTVKYKNDESYACVGYDPSVKKGVSLKQIQKNFLTGSGSPPYMERFTKITPGGDPPWQGKENLSYGGVFGGPDPPPTTPPTTPFRSPLSPAWPYSNDPTSPIRNGVYLTYWNFGNRKGMHTSSIGGRFSKSSEGPYLPFFPGNSSNLVPSGASLATDRFKEVYLNSYATFEGDLKWSVQEVLT